MREDAAPGRRLVRIGSPDGRHLYAGSLYDHEIIAFAIVRTTFTPGPVDFFVQEVGQTAAAKTITVKNDGTNPMPIAGVSLGGADASSYAIASNTCTATLAVGATCTVGVTFTPTKAYLNATLDIASTGSATSPDSAALSGIGIITQPPPPGLAQLPGDEGCLTFDGREVAADATTAGRCKVAPGIGRLQQRLAVEPRQRADLARQQARLHDLLQRLRAVERDDRAVARRGVGRASLPRRTAAGRGR